MRYGSMGRFVSTLSSDIWGTRESYLSYLGKGRLELCNFGHSYQPICGDYLLCISLMGYRTFIASL